MRYVTAKNLHARYVAHLDQLTDMNRAYGVWYDINAPSDSFAMVSLVRCLRCEAL